MIPGEKEHSARKARQYQAEQHNNDDLEHDGTRNEGSNNARKYSPPRTAGVDVTVPMSSVTRQFRPGWPATLLALACLAVFASLGFWQLDRADQKRQLQAEFEQRQLAAPAGVEELAQVGQELRFRKLRATGVFDPENEILLDNIVHQGRAGYHVITPLRISNSDRVVLVNRGWVPLGRSRQDLPDIETPAQAVAVTGSVEMPASRPLLGGGDSPPAPEGGKVWFFLDLTHFMQQAGYAVEPYVLALDPEQPFGFVRERSRFDARVGMHIGYAIHWFAFALATLLVYLYLNLHKINNE